MTEIMTPQAGIIKHSKHIVDTNTSYLQHLMTPFNDTNKGSVE